MRGEGKQLRQGGGGRVSGCDKGGGGEGEG